MRAEAEAVSSDRQPGGRGSGGRPRQEDAGVDPWRSFLRPWQPRAPGSAVSVRWEHGPGARPHVGLSRPPGDLQI